MIRNDQEFARAQDRRQLLTTTLTDPSQDGRLTPAQRASMTAQLDELKKDIAGYAWSFTRAWLDS